MILLQCLLIKLQVTGRVLIDYYGYQKHHEGLERQGTNEVDGEKSESKALYATSLPKVKQEANIKEMLSRGSDMIFVSPMLKGFSLKSKLWCKLICHISVTAVQLVTIYRFPFCLVFHLNCLLTSFSELLRR